MPRTYIAHIDLDCFFVSVERINDKSLVGKPVVVGGSPRSRGVVASASYEARKYGVRSAMPTAQAKRLCPDLIVVHGHHSEYSKYSELVYGRMLTVAPLVERASIDEMYLDFTDCSALYKSDLPGFMKTLQRIVLDEFQLPSTIGLASNKLVAKIAANTVKPQGVIYVAPGTEEGFLAPLPAGVIPGIGRKTEERLLKLNFKTVRDLQSLERKKFISMFGASGEWLFNASHGRGSSSLETEHAAKSISKEETFSTDISGLKELESVLFQQVKSVCASLRSVSSKSKKITLKLRTSEFKTITRQRAVDASDYDPDIYKTAKVLLSELYDPGVAYRLLGVGLSDLIDPAQTELDLCPIFEKRERVLKVMDHLREKFGDDSITIGGS